jgi:hypothetical protein
MAASGETMYALYHVNTKTGEAVRYLEDNSPATSKESAEAEALTARIAKTLMSPYYDGWQTFALPEGTASVDPDSLTRLPVNGGAATRRSR